MSHGYIHAVLQLHVKGKRPVPTAVSAQAEEHWIAFLGVVRIWTLVLFSEHVPQAHTREPWGVSVLSQLRAYGPRPPLRTGKAVNC